ncbi:MAG: hypothetical protein RMK18_07760 [Armatimonadota bacterium]|nr:hypothetical protein [Armatimonadota bacterium]MDW8025739.1 hypothetical protein [Armatimonadota bacterium]
MNVVLLFLLSLLGGAAFAARIEPIGVLGNSGEGRATLVYVGNMPFERCSTGVAIDRDMTLWVSGGDAINRIGLDGRLIERIPIEPKGSIVNSRTFAVVNDVLYFLGDLPSGKQALFCVSMRGNTNRLAKPLPISLPERKRDYIPYCLAPQPIDGQLVIACEPKEFQDARIGVYLVRPPSDANPKGDIKLAFTISGEYPHGVAVDEPKRHIYIGGFFGLFIGGETHQAAYAIAAFKPDGAMLDGFPVTCTKTPAIPTQFRGVISLAGDALWDTAWYGFLSRLDLQGHGAPGRIVEWHHELGYPTQVICIAESAQKQLLAITTAMPNALYLAHWDKNAQSLSFVRRIGCLPIISSLGLSDDGWVTVGTERAQLWWRWEDDADAPPRKAELHIAVTPVYFDGERCFALAAQYRLDDLQRRSPVPTIFSRRVGDRNEAWRVGEPVPMKKPTGLSVRVVPGKPNAFLFVTDASDGQIWRTDFWLPELRPSNDRWKPINVEGKTLKSPTDVVALTDGRLLVADEGRILLLAQNGDVYRILKEFATWGAHESQCFGKKIRMSVDGNWMLISDTERHRLIWLDWHEWKFIAQFGMTDRAGNDATHLNEPTLVSLKGSKAVVADSGNQRLLKLKLIP